MIVTIFTPLDIPNPNNIIFDFKKIITKHARKYVEITTIDPYTYISPMYDDEHTFDIMNEEDAHRIIKEFIVNKEKSPELIFQLGFCENPRCLMWRDELPDNCCKHRIASFNYDAYDADYTYITGYSDITYKIKIIL